MNNLFGLLQKTKSFSPHVFTDDEPRSQQCSPLLEISFSDDDVGRQLSCKWEDFISCDNNTKEKMFKDFSQLLHTSHQPLLHTISRLNQRFVPRPSSVSEVCGHPSDVVVGVAKMLLDALIVDESSALEWIQTTTDSTDKLLLSDALTVNIKDIFSPDLDCDNSSSQSLNVDDDDFIRGRRQWFLIVLQTLCTLLQWPHNRSIVLSLLGRNFVRLFVQVMRPFISKLAELIVVFMEDQHDSNTTSLSDEFDFVMSVLLMFAQLIGETTQGCSIVNGFCDFGLVPAQPWPASWSYRSGYDHPILSLDDFASDTIHKQKKELEISLPSDDCGDAWLSCLVYCGAIRMLLSLLTKLSHFSRTLNSHYGYEHSGMSEIKWVKCVYLQNETLFSLCCIMVCYPRSFYQRFSICNGPEVVGMLFASDLIGKHSLLDYEILMGVHRGILCLFIENLLSAVHLNSEPYSSPIVDSQNICNFMLWIQGELKESHFDIVRRYHELRDMVISVKCPKTYTLSSQHFHSSDYERLSSSNYDFTISSWCDNDVYSRERIIETCLESYSKPPERSTQVVMNHFVGRDGELPWFMCGLAGRIWPSLFDMFFKACIKHHNAVAVLITYYFDVILSGTEQMADAVVSADVSHALPVFQFYYLQFLSRCLEHCPIVLIASCRKHKVWSLLCSSQYFINGGYSYLKGLLQSPDDRNDEKDDYVCTWKLHLPGLTCRAQSFFSDVTASPSSEGTKSLRRKVKGLEDDVSRVNKPSEDEIKRMRAESIISTTSNSYADDQNSSAGSSEAGELSYFEHDEYDYIDSSSFTVRGDADVNPPLKKNLNFNSNSDRIYDRIAAFAWCSISDCIFDLLEQVVRATEDPTCGSIEAEDPTYGNFESRISSGVEVYSVLQALVQESPDYIILQSMRWIRMAIHRNFLKSLRGNDRYRHVMSKCISICKYQILSLATTLPHATPKMKSPLWIGEISTSYEKEHSLHWPARYAAIDLLVFIAVHTNSESWIKAFIPRPITSIAESSRRSTNNLERPTAVAPTLKHVSLLLLMLDPRCRDPALYIVIELLHVFACRCHGLDDRGRFVNSRSSENSSHRQSQRRSKESKTIYHALFHDVVKGLLVNHVRYAHLQPRWCDGPNLVIKIHSYLTHFIKNSERSLYTAYYSKLFGGYGTFGQNYMLCNWTKPRPNIFRESFISIQSCLKSSIWESDDNSAVLKSFILFWAAIMESSEENKMMLASMMFSQKLSSFRTSANSDISRDMIVGCVGTCEDFVNIVLAVEPTPSWSIFVLLFDMMLEDHLEGTIGTNFISSAQFFCGCQYKIKNLNAVPIIMALLPFSPVDTQSFVVQALCSLLTGHSGLANLTLCSQMRPSLVDLVLDIFTSVESSSCLEYLLNIIELIGKNYITVAQLKRIFRLMQNKGSEYRPPYTWMLLRSLRKMVRNEEHCKYFLLFEGRESGLAIPPIHKWPAQNGYSFCTTFCIHKVQSSRESSFSGTSYTHRDDISVDAIIYRPTIFSFRQVNGIGVEVYLSPNQKDPQSFSLMIHVFKETIESALNRIELTFTVEDGKKNPITENRWYFFAFAHNVASFRSRSEVLVLLNDSVFRFSLQFPRFNDKIPQPMIGDCMLNHQARGHLTAFRGQMGSIYFFSEALSEMQMRCLQSFESHDSRDIGSHSKLYWATETLLGRQLQSIYSSLMLAYTPAVWEGNYLIDNTPEKNTVKWHKSSKRVSRKYAGEESFAGRSAFGDKMHARILPNTHRCVCLDMRDALDCLGGIKVLLPFFGQFDQPVLSADNNVLYDADERMAIEVMRLFFSLLRDTPQSRIYMEESGFGLLAYFIERISPQNLSEELLETFLVGYKELSWNQDWQDSFLTCILCNFKLWMFAPYCTQLKLVCSVLDLSKQDPGRLRSVLSVKYFIESLSIVYPHGTVDDLLGEDNVDDIGFDGASPTTPRMVHESGYNPFHSLKRGNTMYVVKKYVHEVTGNSIGVKLTGAELDVIRKQLFDIIFVLISNGQSVTVRDDMNCLMCYISNEKIVRSRIQGLRLLLKLLDLESTASLAFVVSSLCYDQKLNPLLTQLSCPNPAVRLYSFLALCNIFRLAIELGNLPDKIPVSSQEDDGYLTDDDTKYQPKPEDCVTSHTDGLNADTLEYDSYCSPPGSSRRRADSVSGRPSRTPSTVALDTPSTHGTLSPSQQSSNVTPPIKKKLDKFMQRNHSLDIFQDLGVPIDELPFMFSFVIEKLLEIVNDDILNFHSVQVQCKIIAAVLYLSVLGKSSIYIQQEIDKLYADDDSQLYCESRSSPTPIERKFSADEIHDTRSTVGDSKTSECDFLSSMLDSYTHCESAICIPGIIPSLLHFVSVDAVSSNLRLSILVSLKSALQFPDNCDMFLQLPCWQTSILDILISEQRRMLSLQSRIGECGVVHSHDSHTPRSSIYKDYKKSEGIIDTITRIMCDLFIFAQNNGCPPPGHCVSRPLSYKEHTTRSIVDVISAVKNGSRTFGVVILKETMSFLRCYAEKGELDMNVVGLSLLQQIVNSLSSLQAALKNSSMGPEHHRILRRRVVNVTIWLTTSIILDFVTSPVVYDGNKLNLLRTQKRSLRRKSSKRSEGKRSNPKVIYRRYSYNPRNVSSHMHSSVPTLSRNASDTDVIPRQYSRNSSIPPLFLSSDGGSDSSSLFDDDKDSDTSDDFSLSFSSRGDMRRTYTETDIALLNAFQPFGDFMRPQNTYSEALWSLIESSLSLLDSIDTQTSSALLKVRVGMEMGVRAGTQIYKCINDVIDAFIPDTWDTTISQSPPHVMQQLPVDNISAKVDWRIVRLLCNMFVECGRSSEVFPYHSESWPMKALNRLSGMIGVLKTKDREYKYNLESTIVIAKLVDVLRITSRKPTDLWVHKTLCFVANLLGEQRHGVCDCLKSIGFDYEPEIEVAKSLESIISLTVDVNALSDIDEEKMEALYLSRSTAYDANSRCHSTADITLKVIETILCIPERCYLSWGQWCAAMDSVLDVAIKTEDFAASTNVSDIGIDFGSIDAFHRIEAMRLKEFNYCCKLKCNVDNSTLLTYQNFKKVIRQVVADKEATRRIYASQWNVILQDLANERGPWGIGIDDAKEVHWMLDLCENHARMRLKLVRNPNGSNHSMATFFGNPTFNENSWNTKFERKEYDSHVNAIAPFVDNDTIMIRTLNQGLWKDILKYQTNDYVGFMHDETPHELATARSTSPGIHDDVDAGDLRYAKNEKRGEEKGFVSSESSNRVIFQAKCEIITPATNTTNPPASGSLDITKTLISFKRMSDGSQAPAKIHMNNKLYENQQYLWACKTFNSATWKTEDIIDIQQRNYQLRFVAVEFFLSSRMSIFINFNEEDIAWQCIVVIRRTIKPPHIIPFYGRIPKEIIQRAILPGNPSMLTYTKAWEAREISNFEYLMALNTIAGRTYNDLGQYPIMPWVIADYESVDLKLREPSTYRDLMWPIGAQTQVQREILQAKYSDINYAYEKSILRGDDNLSLPPFHYGSHYSASAFVLWYLIRMEPFSSLHIQLQDGRFDRPDRLLRSIGAAWHGCMSNASDIKELIPEYFFLPEAFENINNLDLGTTQNGRSIREVELPPWAKNPYDFTAKHRKALESEYVSLNLHHWIDLIFGYKQRPPYLKGGSQATIDACNVFFHLTYAGAVDLDSLRKNDISLYEQYVSQIAEFGQTPAQLFTEPHVKRQPLYRADITWPIASIIHGADTVAKGDYLPDKPRKLLCFKAYEVSSYPVVFVGETVDRLITVDISRIIACHMWQSLSPDVIPPYKLKVDIQALELSRGFNDETSFSVLPGYSSTSSARERRAGVPFSRNGLCCRAVALSSLVDDDVAKSVPKSIREFLREERESRRLQGSSSGKVQNTSREADEGRPRTLSSTQSFLRRKEKSTTVREDYLTSHLFVLVPDLKLLFSCGHWDHTFKATCYESGKLLQSIKHHKDIVTCMAVTTDYGKTWLATGSRDCTLMIWDVVSRDLPVALHPIHLLYGHDDAVTCVAVNAQVNVVVSGSDDGTLIIHSLRDGSYIRSIVIDSVVSGPGIRMEHLAHKRRVNWVSVTCEGLIVTYLMEEGVLLTYSVNGRQIAKKDTRERLFAFCLSNDGHVFLCGGENCLVVMRWVATLEVANDGPRKDLDTVLDGSVEGDVDNVFSSPIRSIFLSGKERHLIVGTESGEIRVFAQDSDYLRQRLQRKLEEIGIL